ncbi:agamous-like MADS-box protein AGL62 [Apium graveolens]|uniref:agamous-like MADS-box protein AGL62 n=1 Tax=Apium graveolens TaxID=4045 RepID=UPI003D7BD0C9
MMQQAQDLTGLSLEGGEPADGPDAAFGIVMTPQGEKKVYSFGQPNLEPVMDKFITPQHPNPAADSGVVLQLVDPPILAELNGHLYMLHDHLENLAIYAERLESERSQRQAKDWFEAPVENLGLEQLQMLKSGLT